MSLTQDIALVSGSNQGIGRGFVQVLLERGIKKVYAGARRPETLAGVVEMDPNRVIPVELDITKTDHRRAAAEKAPDVTLLVNNAGIAGSENGVERRFLSATNLDDARDVMETDYWAMAEMCRLFLPPMMQRGDGTVINILSIGALFCLPEYATYCAAKSAAAVMTQGLRAELSGTGVFIAGVFTGGVKTRMSAKNPQEHMSPEDHARQVLDAVAQGEEDIFAGARADELRDAIRQDPKAFEHMHIERFQNTPME